MDRSGRQGLGLAGWAVPEWEVAGQRCRNGGGGAGMGRGRTAVPEWMVPEGGMGYETF